MKVLYFTSDHQIAVYNVAEATRMAHLNLAPAAGNSSRFNKSGYSHVYFVCSPEV